VYVPTARKVVVIGWFLGRIHFLCACVLGLNRLARYLRPLGSYGKQRIVRCVLWCSILFLGLEEEEKKSPSLTSVGATLFQ
jgi:hypothetical protein